jgi:cytochrome b561
MTGPPPAPPRYSGTAIALHWLVFALIACGFALAVYMTGLPLSPLKLKYYSWHKWIGVTVFLLALARLCWRLTHAAPPPVAMPVWQRRAAAVAHALLYVLIVVIPLSGWLYSSATGVPTVYLGLLQLPDLLTRDKALAEVLKNVHVSLNYTMLALVVVHAAAALKHHFIDGDNVLARMLPFAKLREKL